MPAYQDSFIAIALRIGCVYLVGKFNTISGVSVPARECVSNVFA